MSGCEGRSIPLSSTQGPALPLEGDSQPFHRDIASAVRSELDRADRNPAFSRLESIDLGELYRASGAKPMWVDAQERPNQRADEALTLLRHAADDGLEPADYNPEEIAQLATSLHDELQEGSRQAARFDVTLSSAMLRYFRDLHTGRVDPATVGFRLSGRADGLDFPALLRTAIESDRIAETARQLPPPLAQYGALRAVLARYRALAASQGESLPASKAIIRAGNAYPAVGALSRRLVSLGDLPEDAPGGTASGRYERAVVGAIKHFQLRHGLDANGVLGPRTLAALQVPLPWRVRQIELALERLRWLPQSGGERVIVLNIPMFRLWAWDAARAAGTPSLGMDAIVGRAPATETPVLVEQMREVIFRPYWNVPPSIVGHEILPAIDRDPNYLDSEKMEIVRGAGDDAVVVDPTPESLADLRRGALRVRQRPGPGNALGLIKFVFPNAEDIYMHGTPAAALFARSRRDFSHGCVRVADPVALAEWVLRDDAAWDRQRILGAVAGSKTIRVKLLRPIQVILFYATAAVMPEDGTVRFAEDIYHHDGRLDKALAARHSFN
jgi:murein L,D-transpeptidase YcbB/YkuD